MAIEAEVFSDCGAWINFPQLEDSLTLDELIRLYDMAIERQERLMKTVAAAMGADFSDEDDEPGLKTAGTDAGTIMNGRDAAILPIGLGYVDKS